MRIGPLKLNKKRILLILLAGFLLWGFLFFISFDESVFTGQAVSSVFLDQNDEPLRRLLSENSRYSQRCNLAEISPHFLRAIVLVEDKHFYSHRGVRFSSLARALSSNIRSRRVVSGGSTITMQLAKLVHHHHKRHIWNKISEVFKALRFEIHLKKDKILTEYVNRLPFGNMIYGIKEASRYYFNKDPSQLSLNQAIYLALIPKSPSRYNPRKHLHNLQKRWIKILNTFLQKDHISRDEFSRARQEGIGFIMEEFPFVAPHFIDMLTERYFQDKIPSIVHTTIKRDLQETLKGIVRSHLLRLEEFGVSSAAVVVINNKTHQIEGFIGSPDYFNKQSSGFVNLAVAMRQPGSTLKPFVYALALERGYTPSTILPDIHFPAKGGFFPKNHDGRHHGPIRLRQALACSYNIPAFYLAMKLSPAAIIERLKLAGFHYLHDEPGFYGETIALGAGEVTLLDLTVAYSAFANGGVVFYPAVLQDQTLKKWTLYDERTAFLTWHILQDPAARHASFGYVSAMSLPFPVAVKTGTSKGFRDKWAIGVNGCFTVGVWLGNPDGKNMKDLTRVGNAPTILRDIFLAIQKEWLDGDLPVPEGIVKHKICSLSGELATPHCPNTVEEYFIAEQQPQQSCTYHQRTGGRVVVRYPELYRLWAQKTLPASDFDLTLNPDRKISFPQNGDRFYIHSAIKRKSQQIPFEVMGFSSGERFDFILNGRIYQSVVVPQQVLWTLQQGRYTLSVRKSNKILDTIKFMVH